MVSKTASSTRFKDADNGFEANVVERADGKKAVAIDGTVQIEQLFGQDNLSDTWFYIGTSDNVCDGVGAVNDTVRVQIAGGCDLTLYPAVDVTITVTSAVVNDPKPAFALAELIVSELEADANFQASWEAFNIGENGTIHISALEDLYGEVGQRTTLGSFTVSSTGTTVVTPAFTSITRRGKSTSLARDPRDPRIGTLGVSGSIRIRADEVDEVLQERAVQVGGSNENLVVNGSGTPVAFRIEANPEGGANKFIDSLKLYGTDGNIKVGEANFLGANSPLTNGIQINFYKQGILRNSRTLRTTNDILGRFSSSASDNKIINQSGGDYIEATFNLVAKNIVVELEAGENDYVEVLVRDNLTGVNSLYLLADGFLEN